MAFQLTPRHEDLINEPIEKLEDLLNKIPTNALLVTVAAMNARIDSKISDQDNLKFFFRRIPEKYPSIILNINKFIKKGGAQISIFSKLHLCKLAIFALKSPNKDLRDTTPTEDWLLFKAYLIIIGQHNDYQEDTLKTKPSSTLNFFNNLTWPLIAEQYQFLGGQSNRSELFDMIRTITLVDYLIENNFHDELKNYSQTVGMPILDMISNIFGMANQKQLLEYGGWKTPSFFIKLNNATNDIFRSLILDIENVNKEKNYEDNYLGLKKYPLLGHKEDTLIIINRQFLQNRIYNGFIFDFYIKSGIKKSYKEFDIFKSIIGKEVSERRLFKPLIESIFSKNHHIKEFSEKDSHPDCYLRIHNRIFLIEFKDYMMPTRVISSFDSTLFKGEIDKKFVMNERKEAKGVSQLAIQINALEETEFDFDKVYTYGINRQQLEIYPIIIYTDYQYSIPGINNYLTNVFRSKTREETQFKKIYDPTLININFLFKYSNYIAGNRLDVLIKSYINKKNKNERDLEKYPTPNKWIEANLSFDDIGVPVDLKLRSGVNILHKFLKNIDLKNVI